VLARAYLVSSADNPKGLSAKANPQGLSFGSFTSHNTAEVLRQGFCWFVVILFFFLKKKTECMKRVVNRSVSEIHMPIHGYSRIEEKFVESDPGWIYDDKMYREENLWTKYTKVTPALKFGRASLASDLLMPSRSYAASKDFLSWQLDQLKHVMIVRELKSITSSMS
jgi:hypothetical protein